MSACRVTCRGYVEGMALTEVDLQALTERILSGDIGREEFYVEIYDGGTLTGTVHAGPLYPAEANGRATAWCVTFSEPNEEGRWCLAGPLSGGKYEWYVFCGGETEILDACAVSLSSALEGIYRCCKEAGRARSLRWISIDEAMNL